MRTRITAVANQKGGVGKTTTVINLGASLAVHDLDILIVDFDPQTNATSGLGIKTDKEKNINSIVTGEYPIDEAIIKTEVDGLSIIPGSKDLAGLEIELATIKKREFFLKESLESIRGKYDFILIDCPPSLGLLTLNGLVAADDVLLPLQSEYYALEGLSHLIETIKKVKKLWNSSLRIHGVLLTMFDKRLNLSREVAANAEENLGDIIYKTRIPRNVRISEAPSFGKPVLLYAAYSAGAKSYLNLAREVMSR